MNIPLPLQPASGAIIAEPLGVVLVLSTWNLPLGKKFILGCIAHLFLQHFKLFLQEPTGMLMIPVIVCLIVVKRPHRW